MESESLFGLEVIRNVFFIVDCAKTIWTGSEIMTAQIHEILIWDGQRLSIAYTPPLSHDRELIVSVELNECDDETRWMISSTACWRGYQGTWEIREGRFYLVSLTGRFRLNSNEPVFADWFCGVLRIPRGELIEYVHMGFGSVYAEELHVKIDGGMVIDSRPVDNRSKSYDKYKLSLQNLPGSENFFSGDDW